MKSLFTSILFGLSSFSIAADHPPPGLLTTVAAPECSCRLDANYELVHHTAQRHLLQVFSRIAMANGLDPSTYSLDLMRDRRGKREINAMTCAHSRVIWVSVTAWERLHTSEIALGLLLAHELAHGVRREAGDIRRAATTPGERRLLLTLTDRQVAEVAADQLAADYLLTAGYSPSQINQAKHFILAQNGDGMLARASASHPAGRDRANLLTYYLGRVTRNTILVKK